MKCIWMILFKGSGGDSVVHSKQVFEKFRKVEVFFIKYKENANKRRTREGSMGYTVHRQFDHGQKASAESIKQLATCFVVWLAETAG